MHNAIVWQDTRTDALCTSSAGDGGRDRFRQQTGLPLATYFSGHQDRAGCSTTSPGARAGAEAGELALRHHRLLADLEPHRRPHGGVHVTDVTNA